MSSQQPRKNNRAAELTTADLVVLSLVSARPMHGYELVKEYERQEVQDWASVSRPHVYYALQKLSKGKFIAKVKNATVQDQRGKITYQITREGTQALETALSSLAWAQSRPPTPFDTWLGLSLYARPDDKINVIAARRDYLKAQIKKEQRTLREIEQIDGQDAEIAKLMVGMCIELFETQLRWLQKLK